MRQPRSSQVHVSQAVPRASSLTWTMTGDPDINKVFLLLLYCSSLLLYS